MMKLISGIILVSVIVSGVKGDTANLSEKNVLLPETLKPIHYDVHLKLKVNETMPEDISIVYYYGDVTILIKSMVKKVKEMELNFAGISTIVKSYFDPKGKKPKKMQQGKFDQPAEKIYFKLPKTIRKGKKFAVRFKIDGINKDFNGLASEFYNMKNKTKSRYFYANVFPAKLRYIFPCFDEPKYNATFTVSVSLPKHMVNAGYHVLSMTKETKKKEKNGYVLTKFEKTKTPIACHAFSLLISDLVANNEVKTGNRHNVLLRSWTDRCFLLDTMTESESTNHLVSKTIDYFMDMFNIKDDVINHVHKVPIPVNSYEVSPPPPVVPTTPTNSSTEMEGLYHSLSLMWIKNVRIQSWSEWWLPQAFAGYFEYFMLKNVVNELQEDDSNIKDEDHARVIIRQIALSMDFPELEIPSLHDIYNPKLLTQHRQTYALCKGSIILGMWKNVIGDKRFEQFYRDHLKILQREIVTTFRLLKHMDDFVKKYYMKTLQPSQMYNRYLTEKGFPIVRVERYRNNQYCFNLTQSVFHMHKTTKYERMSWSIPFTFSSDHPARFIQKNHFIWQDSGLNIPFGTYARPTWLLVTHNQGGYFRVNYERKEWNALYQNMGQVTSKITGAQKAQMMDDVLELAKATNYEEVDYYFALKMLLHMKNDNNIIPWSMILNHLIYIKNLLLNMPSTLKKYENFLRDFLGGRINKDITRVKKCQDDPYQLSEKIVSLACEIGLINCNSKDFVVPGPQVQCATVRRISTCLKYRNEKHNTDFKELWFDYLTASTNDDRNIILMSFGCNSNATTIKNQMTKIFDTKQEITREEKNILFDNILNGNQYNYQIVLNIIEKNLEVVCNAINKNIIMPEIFIKLAQHLGNDDELSRIKHLYYRIKSLPVVNEKLNICMERAIRTVKLNNDWIKFKGQEIDKALDHKYF